MKQSYSRIVEPCLIGSVEIEGTAPLLYGKRIDKENFPRRGAENALDALINERLPLPAETSDEYQARTWRERAHYDEDGFLCIPARGVEKAIHNTARYTGGNLGCGSWAGAVMRGVRVAGDAELKPHMTREDLVAHRWHSRRCGRKTELFLRMFPMVEEWSATFRIIVSDYRLSQERLEDYLTLAGIINGLGIWRPQNGGNYGRFKVVSVRWSPTVLDEILAAI